MANSKELVITMSEAEQETVAAMNTIMQKHGLPCFLFEPIVDKIHRQLIDGKTSELEAAKARYADSGGGSTHESNQ